MADLTRTCAALNADEPLAGTAQGAVAHVFIEHLGPWPTDPLEALDPSYAAALRTLGARVGLVRRPAEERDPGRGLPERPYVIVATNGQVAAARTDGLPSIAELGDVLATLARDDVPDGWSAPAWLVLVCTHASRDACCARLGQPLLGDLAEVADPSRIWETTHLGGHRFAPTCLALPSQVAYGRVTRDRVSDLIDALAADEVLPDLMRGRTTYGPALQVAEIVARQRLDVRGRLELVAHSEVDGATTATWLADDRTLTVTVTQRPGVPRKVSCAKDKLETQPVYEVA
jgi:hypothetical protein